jgi:type I restriction enzyme, S subunit
MKTLKPYPEYKPSGVEWLGEIPEHWEVVRLKWLVSKIGSGKTPRGGAQIYADSGVLFLRSQNVHFDGLRLDDAVFIDNTIDADMVTTRVRSGDVLLNITGASLGRCCAVPDGFPPANVSQHVCIIRPQHHRVETRFLSSNLASRPVQAQVFADEVGTSREGLAFDQVSNLLVALPTDLNEQRAIGKFLDRETARIDGLVAKKERLIALLQEKRTALISHAVTKGLNPAAPMKDSGVEWLGQIPAHWEVLHLKRCLQATDYGISDSTKDSGRFKVLTMGNIQNGELNFDGVGFVNSVPKELLLEAGDLLFNRTNSLELVGKVGIFRGHSNDGVTFASYLVRLRVNQRALPGFLNYLLNCEGLLGVSRSIAFLSINQANLNPNRYGFLRIALPPVDEQAAIAGQIIRETAKLDALMAKIRTGIERLQEYRTALISAAVTGKIDVRQTSSRPSQTKGGSTLSSVE